MRFPFVNHNLSIFSPYFKKRKPSIAGKAVKSLNTKFGSGNNACTAYHQYASTLSYPFFKKAVPTYEEAYDRLQKRSSTMADTFDVFISHAREDKETIAEEIYNRLERRQIRAFFDKEELQIGGNAPEEMITAMETASVGVFILSPEFAATHWPMKGLECFLRRARQAGDGEDTDGSLRPRVTLIPVFYRMTGVDCSDDKLFKKYGQVLLTTDLFDRVNARETNVKRILDALKELSGRTGIENTENANNEPTETIKRQRMRLVQRICSKVITAASNRPYVIGSGAVFSSTISAGRTLARVAEAEAPNEDKRCLIKFAISNNTGWKLRRVGSHMESGEIARAPDIVDSRGSDEGELIADSGIKGALLYQWDDEKEKICLFLQNQRGGAYRSGIEYYWDTWETDEWYFDDVSKMREGREMKGMTGKQLRYSSFISMGDRTGCAFALETT